MIFRISADCRHFMIIVTLDISLQFLILKVTLQLWRFGEVNSLYYFLEVSFSLHSV